MTTLPHMLTTDGSWVQLEADPLKPHEELETWEKGAEAAGYYQWDTFGCKDDNPLWLEIYRLYDKHELTIPLFMVVVSAREHYEVVYAESLPAMMDLRARWAPALQAAALTELLGRLDDPLTKHGFAGLVRNVLT